MTENTDAISISSMSKNVVVAVLQRLDSKRKYMMDVIAPLNKSINSGWKYTADAVASVHGSLGSGLKYMTETRERQALTGLMLLVPFIVMGFWNLFRTVKSLQAQVAALKITVPITSSDAAVVAEIEEEGSVASAIKGIETNRRIVSLETDQIQLRNGTKQGMLRMKAEQSTFKTWTKQRILETEENQEILAEQLPIINEQLKDFSQRYGALIVATDAKVKDLKIEVNTKLTQLKTKLTNLQATSSISAEQKKMAAQLKFFARVYSRQVLTLLEKLKALEAKHQLAQAASTSSSTVPSTSIASSSTVPFTSIASYDAASSSTARPSSNEEHKGDETSTTATAEPTSETHSSGARIFGKI